MDIDIGSLRCMAPSLGIPPHRHYDPSDLEDAGLRLEWAKFLFRAGYRLRYPQETTGTAVLLFHRFLIQERVGKHRRSRDVILTTCLFLAGKVTEAPRRLRDVINVLHMLTRTSEDEPPLLDKAYWTMKEKIVEFEQVLLRTINFQVDPPDPYRLLLNYARSLRLDRTATRTAWGLVNDTLLCPRALSAPPPAIACAAIRMATRIHGSDRRLRWFSPPCHNFSTARGNSNKNKRPTALALEKGDGVGIGSGGVVSGAGVLGPGGDGPGGGSTNNVDSSSAIGGAGSAGGDGAGGGRANERAASGQEKWILSPTTTDDVNVMVPTRREPAAGVTDGGGNGRRSPGASAHEADSTSGGGLEVIHEAVGATFGAGAAGAVVDPTGAVGGESTGEGWRDSGDAHAETEIMTSAIPWWGLFDARDEEVELVCAELLALYRAQGDNMGKNGSDACAGPILAIEQEQPSVAARAASVAPVSTD